MYANGRIQASVYQKPKKGNYHCGDSYLLKETEDEFICALADGLGSGEYAKESSQVVMDIIEQNPGATVDQLIKLCNQSLSGKRGVVLGILKLDFVKQTYTFTSIGNIGVMTITSNLEKKRNIPNSGYLGGYPRKLKVSVENLEKGMVFIMFSDGVSSRELSSKYFLRKDVQAIIDTYAKYVGQSEVDDTTLIALKYA
ncbi:SpoIIE family protein phosphatase [Aquibacillus salsiterrae]|uniref:SpoIIE family protein phosphatase n=1 Tax=Aquibacillus salsiterrae TaxID=2950439 RepID=A0A9X4AHW8_9BACI|nr:SpoIIE family protein phosphatase [Aquibacillus salsiterrae]MDC3418673.1 SpoIIE family protein phosphatase [Aquibacillus salsiterrae]